MSTVEVGAVILHETGATLNLAAGSCSQQLWQENDSLAVKAEQPLRKLGMIQIKVKL